MAQTIYTDTIQLVHGTKLIEALFNEMHNENASSWQKKFSG